MPQYVLKGEPRACQGDIYQSLAYYEAHSERGQRRKTTHGYVVVLTQNCDLAEDWNAYRAIRDQGARDQDKLLRDVILAPCYPYALFLEGNHIEGRAMSKAWRGSSLRNAIEQNNHKRFHFLPTQEGVNLPRLVVDFKHYFTMNRDEFYLAVSETGHYVATLGDLFREDLSQRFAYYLARIGLPDDARPSPPEGQGSLRVSAL